MLSLLLLLLLTSVVDVDVDADDVDADDADEEEMDLFCGTKKLTSLTKRSHQPPKAYWGYMIKVKSIFLI